MSHALFTRSDSMTLGRLIAFVVAVSAACGTPGCDRTGAGEAMPLAGPGQAAVDSATALNVLLVTIDTLRADHLGCYGYSRATSPRIDALAAKGTLFEHCLVQWPKTGPSLASMLTSTYGSTSGVMRTTLEIKVPLNYDLLPELFKAGGFATFGVVANLSLSEKFQYNQGFERFFVQNGSQSSAGHVTPKAIDLLAARDPARPFFAWVHYLDPHAPYCQGRKYVDGFRSDELYQRTAGPVLKVEPKAIDAAAADARFNDIGMVPAYAYEKDYEQLRDYVAAYDSDIRYLDDQLGLLLDWMQGKGLLDRTIVVVTADHGEGLGGHNYFFEHGRLPYDDCARVPLIVVHPQWAPRRVAAPVALLDLAPTLADANGLRPGWQFEGQSLLPWLAAGAPADQARPVFVESGYATLFDLSVRRGRWKLIRFGEKWVVDLIGAKKYELYDIETDPLETNNLLDAHDLAPQHDAIFTQLRDELDAYADAAYSKTTPDPSGVELTEEERKRMIELGYAKDGASAVGEEHR
ncbi:MAG: hypothetical protein EXS13_09885 [Planctomycetes bacterium]|nr:hypothetical protein [Planctomycetota bacterium]